MTNHVCAFVSICVSVYAFVFDGVYHTYIRVLLLSWVFNNNADKYPRNICFHVRILSIQVITQNINTFPICDKC
jgi:hypothetical protein